MIIDLPDVGFKLAAAAAKQARGLFSAFRYGLFAEGKARVVIDTAGPVKIKSAGMTRPARACCLNVVLTATDAATFGVGTGATRQSGPPAEDKAARLQRTGKPKPRAPASP